MPKKSIPKIVYRNIDIPNSHEIEVYIKNGGYQALTKVLKKMNPEDVIDLVKKSGLRGRGGAGFPTGLKWDFTRRDIKEPKYLICNAEEGEPGTFKDRPIIENDPHAIIEGMIIGGYVIGSNKAYIGIRGEYIFGQRRLEKAIEQAKKRNYLGKNILGTDFNFDIQIYRGAGAYICGEETALINSFEGLIGFPRIRPPFPVNAGLRAKPTAVNNVETLANIAPIIVNGPEWYAQFGSEECKGTKVYSLSGHVNKPGNYELEMGATLRELIFEHGEGMLNGRKFKAVLPGGASSSCLTSDYLDVKMDFGCLAAAGSMLGSGAVIVINEDTCMVGVAKNLLHFFISESCGRCTPCREGVPWLGEKLKGILQGKGVKGDIDLLLDLSEDIMVSSFCPLGQSAVNAVLSTIKNFRDEYEYHIEKKKCPLEN